MLDWSFVIVPALSGLAAFVGSISGIRVHVWWIRRELTRHEGEIHRIRDYLKMV